MLLSIHNGFLRSIWPINSKIQTLRFRFMVYFKLNYSSAIYNWAGAWQNLQKTHLHGVKSQNSQDEDRNQDISSLQDIQPRIIGHHAKPRINDQYADCAAPHMPSEVHALAQLKKKRTDENQNDKWVNYKNSGTCLWLSMCCFFGTMYIIFKLKLFKILLNTCSSIQSHPTFEQS